MVSLQKPVYTDLTKIVDVNPPAYNPDMEDIYNERLLKKEAAEQTGESEEAIALKWLAEHDDPRIHSRGDNVVMGSRNQGRTSKLSFSSGKALSSEGENDLTKACQTNEEEDVFTFSDTFGLDDEDLWLAVPRSHLIGRFSQYRQLSRVERNRLEEYNTELKLQAQKRLTETKSQFISHKELWMQEKDALLRAMEQAEHHRAEAQKCAEDTLAQMEVFISATENKEAFDSHKAKFKSRLEIMETQNGALQYKLEEAVTRLREMEEAMIVKENNVISGIDKDIMEDIPFPPDTGRKALKMEDLSTEHSSIRREMQLADHPIVQEYLLTYEYLMSFTQKLVKFVQDKDIQLPAADILMSFKPVPFNREGYVAPQIQQMRRSITVILDQSINLMQNILKNFRKDMSGLSSRGPTNASRFGGISGRGFSSKTEDTEKMKVELRQVKMNYEELKFQYESSTKKYESQINQSTGLMLEMQSTIEQLRREVSNLQGTGQKTDETVGAGEDTTAQSNADNIAKQNPDDVIHLSQEDPVVYFSKLDSQRNAKMLKRAMLESKLDRIVYEEALNRMEEYTEVPSLRLAYLVKKYLNVQTMNRMAEYVKKNRTLNGSVFRLLDKMEYIIQRRERRYEILMELFRQERLRRAQAMISTFEHVEDSCSIFLIKPVASFKGREVLKSLVNKQMQTRENSHLSGSKVTEMVNREQEKKVLSASSDNSAQMMRMITSCQTAPENIQGFSPVSGSAIRDPLVNLQPTTYWNPMSSQHNRQHSTAVSAWVNTPRLLELDINRLLISQNNISSRYPMSWRPSDVDGLTKYPFSGQPAPHMTVRSYISIARPSTYPKSSGSPVGDLPGVAEEITTKTDVSGPTTHNEPNKAPPTTPLDARVNSADLPKSRGSRDLSGQMPLPPIHPENEEMEGEESAGEEGEELSKRSQESTLLSPADTPFYQPVSNDNQSAALVELEDETLDHQEEQ